MTELVKNYPKIQFFELLGAGGGLLGQKRCRGVLMFHG